MTLIEQIRDISTRWFNTPFAELPINRVVNALGLEAFRRKMQHEDTPCILAGWKFNEDCQAIYLALTYLDKTGLTNDIPAFLL